MKGKAHPWLMTAVLSLLLAALPWSSAAADGFALCYGSEGQSGCLPDNKEHTYCWSDTFEQYVVMTDAGSYAMSNMVSQTTYTKTFISDCTQLTDVVWIRDPNLGAGTRGSYQCQAFNTADECEWSHVRLNPTLLNNDLNRNKTACHELGHSLGLTHHAAPYSDCMVSGAVTSGHQHYNDHHVTHVDNRA